MTHAKKRNVVKQWYSATLEHFEHYPNVMRAAAVVTFCICLTVVVTYVTDYLSKRADLNHKFEIEKVNLEIKRMETEKEKIEAEARKAEAIAATNPYALEAAKNKSCSPVTLTINTPNYKPGTSDQETENNIHAPIKVEANGKKYDPEQRKLLTLTYHIGSQVGYPETMQAILLVETRAGKFGNRIGDTNLPVGKRSYGVMQVKAGTARGVLKRHPELVKEYFPGRTEKSLRDEEIIIRLIQDDVFNIKVATLYYADGRKNSKSWAQSIVRYNQGYGWKGDSPKEHVYYKKVLTHIIKEVRPFNKHVGLTSK